MARRTVGLIDVKAMAELYTDASERRKRFDVDRAGAVANRTDRARVNGKLRLMTADTW